MKIERYKKLYDYWKKNTPRYTLNPAGVIIQEFPSNN